MHNTIHNYYFDQIILHISLSFKIIHNHSENWSFRNVYTSFSFFTIQNYSKFLKIIQNQNVYVIEIEWKWSSSKLNVPERSRFIFILFLLNEKNVNVLILNEWKWSVKVQFCQRSIKSLKKEKNNFMYLICKIHKPQMYFLVKSIFNAFRLWFIWLN